MNRRTQLAVLAAGGALLLTGCGSGDDSAADGSSSTPSSATSASATPTPKAGKSPSEAASPEAASPEAASVITIKDYKYKVPGTVAPGATVMVKNEDTEAHTVTADTGSAFDVTIAPGKTATLTAPQKAGAFPFHCTFHANMLATLTVG